MKLAIIGSSGQLGVDLVQAAKIAAFEVVAVTGRSQLDIADGGAVARFLSDVRPDVLINTAAFHNVDLCEKEPQEAYRVNTLAVAGLARACESGKILLIQVGTDYVMEGAPDNRPLPETARPQPKSIYAVTRYGGDMMTLAHAPGFGYVVRTCGLFGMAGCKLKGGLNFVDTMVAAARAGKTLRVVSDQIVAPTATDELAGQLLELVRVRPGPGLYHAVSHGACSWHEFATSALQLAGIHVPIEAVSSGAFAAPAIRPNYSVLDNARLRTAGLDRMGDWQSALARFVRTKYGGHQAGELSGTGR